jgi:hypothetical protein
MIFRSLAAALLVLFGAAAYAAQPGKGIDAGIVIAMEREALDRSDKGDCGGFADISAFDIVYVDPFCARPVVGLAAFTEYCKHADAAAGHGEMIDPHVQLWGDTAVLTYNYDFTKAKTGAVTHWSTTEVYRLRAGSWRIVNAHWSFARHGETVP